MLKNKFNPCMIHGDADPEGGIGGLACECPNGPPEDDMKPLGRKKTKTNVAGHQDCGVCHPPTKGDKGRERQMARKEIEENTPTQSTILVIGTRTASLLSSELVIRSIWFQVEPKSDDAYVFMVNTHEHSRLIRLAQKVAEMVGPHN